MTSNPDVIPGSREELERREFEEAFKEFDKVRKRPMGRVVANLHPQMHLATEIFSVPPSPWY